MPLVTLTLQQIKLLIAIATDLGLLSKNINQTKSTTAALLFNIKARTITAGTLRLGRPSYGTEQERELMAAILGHLALDKINFEKVAADVGGISHIKAREEVSEMRAKIHYAQNDRLQGVTEVAVNVRDITGLPAVVKEEEGRYETESAFTDMSINMR